MPSPEPRLDELGGFATPRLRLRPLTAADAAAFQKMTDTPTITQSVHFLEHPFTLAHAHALIVTARDGRNCFWGVWRDDALVGTVGTHLQAQTELEIGYWFAECARGHGFAAEAMAGVIARLTRAYPRRRIAAECRPENLASWRLLERIGFVTDGRDGHRAGRKRLTLRTGPQVPGRAMPCTAPSRDDGQGH